MLCMMRALLIKKFSVFAYLVIKIDRYQMSKNQKGERIKSQFKDKRRTISNGQQTVHTYLKIISQIPHKKRLELMCSGS